jgi:predicted secreted protein
MPTLGKVDGTKLILKVGGTAIALTTTYDLNESVDVRDCTNKDSGDWKESAVTRQSWEMTCEGFVAFDAAYGYTELRAAKDLLVPVALSWGTFVTGDPEYSGNANITSLSKSAPDADNTTFNITFGGTGAINEGVSV